MNKVLYLLLLIIIDVHAWNLRTISLSADNWLVIQLLYLMVGFIYYGKLENYSWFSKNLKYWWIWVLGIFLSMVPAYLNYGQTLSQSLITYRRCLLLVQIPVLFKIAPTKEEIVKAVMIYFGFVWVIYFMQQANPLIINIDEESLERILRTGEKPMVIGWLFVIIALFYYLDRIKDQFKIKLLLVVFMFFIFALLEQNRSILFSITAIIGWTMLKVKNNKFLVILTFVILALGVAYYTADTWLSLFEETAEQIDNKEYNRNKAIQYFLFKASPDIWCYIFGNGFLSAHATSHMIDMMELGVYNSDVGFVGYWNQYGVLPIIVFLLLLVPAVIGKKNSHFIRCWAIQILICSVTISYWEPSSLLYIGLFYYLYYVELEKQEEQTNATELIESKEIVKT